MMNLWVIANFLFRAFTIIFLGWKRGDIMKRALATLLLGLISLAHASISITEIYEVAQGNVAITTCVTRITNQYVYTPYGSQKNLTHPIKLNGLGDSYQGLTNGMRKPLNIGHNQFGYTGQSRDSSTGLMMLGGFRNYAPGIGRFIQPDTYNSFSKQGINNPDAYVLGNPLFFTDPTGHVEDPILEWAQGFGEGVENAFNPTDTLEGFEQFPSTIRASLQMLGRALQGDMTAIGALSAGYATGEFRLGTGERATFSLTLNRIPDHPMLPPTNITEGNMKVFFEKRVANLVKQEFANTYEFKGMKIRVDTKLGADDGYELKNTREFDIFAVRRDTGDYENIEVKGSKFGTGDAGRYGLKHRMGETQINKGNLIHTHGGRVYSQNFPDYPRGTPIKAATSIWFMEEVSQDPEIWTLSVTDIEPGSINGLNVQRAGTAEWVTTRDAALNGARKLSPNLEPGFYRVPIPYTRRYYIVHPRRYFATFINSWDDI